MPTRVFQSGDIDFAIGLVLKEGWLYHRAELERMLMMDPEGSFVYEEGGVPLGFITTLTYGKTGVIGHLVVSERARGRRIGQSLVTKAIEYASGKGTESVLLFATGEGAKVYGRQGFHALAEVLCVEAKKVTSISSMPYPGLSSVAEDDLGKIASLDTSIFGDDRSRLLERLYRDYPDLCFKLERSGTLRGYAFGRTTALANDFGPWVCTTGSEADAKALFDAVVSRFDDRSIFMGVFSQNESAVRLAARVASVRSWHTQLMVRGLSRYVEGTEHCLGLVGFELG